MLERDDFKKRFNEETPIFIHEFLYPLLQGYDSVAIKSDIEIGGTDQKFNFIVGREVQKLYGQEPQIILTLPLIEGTDGMRKMSKSYENYIAFLDPPKEIYGKVMSIPDNLVFKYFQLVLWYDEDRLSRVKKEMEDNPRDTKAKLAREIVRIFYSASEARRAEEEFNRVFREGGLPDNIPEFKVVSPQISLIDILVSSGMVKSKTEARRLIRQKAVELSGETVQREDTLIKIKSKEELILRIGKRRFLKLTPA